MEKYITIQNAFYLFILIGLIISSIRQNAFSNALGAFDNKDNGWSGRKMTAFGFSCLTAYTLTEGFKRGMITQGNYIEVLITLVSVVLLALALIKIDDIPKILNSWRGIKSETITEKTTSTTEQKI